MPPILSKPSNAARMAVIYITVGALLVVWTAIWWLYLSRHEGSDSLFYWCYGFFFTGLVLMVIGITIGRIGRSGRSARHAELPPEVSKNERTAEPAVTAPQPGAAPALPPGYFASPQYPMPGTQQPVAPIQGGAVVPPVAQVAPPGPSPRG
jgi:hypothetical protein